MYSYVRLLDLYLNQGILSGNSFPFLLLMCNLLPMPFCVLFIEFYCILKQIEIRFIHNYRHTFEQSIFTSVVGFMCTGCLLNVLVLARSS